MQRPIAVNETSALRPGATFEGDTVVGQLPDGDWLLVAPHDTHKRLEWGCWGERIGTNGTGRENTDKLLKAGSPAAVYCRTALGRSYDLPSREELAMLYQQRGLLGLEGFGWAWSSTEGSSDFSWIQSFSDGNQYDIFKYSEYWVVPVRRISPLQSAEDEVTRLREQRDELLEALEMAVQHFDEWAAGCLADDLDEARLPWLEPARAAIAKAKGES